MELDDLKGAWHELERRVDAGNALTTQLLRERRLDKTRSAMRAMGWGQFAQALFWGIAIGTVIAPFWYQYRDTTHLLAAGIVMHVYAVAAIILSVRQLLQIATVDYAAPVVELQRHLACLRRTRVNQQLWLGLPWWLLWVVATMIGAKRWWGIDIYAPAPAWIYVALGIGVVGIALTLWLPRIVGRTPRGSRVVQGLLDDLAGHSLMRVTRQLDEIAGFSKE